MKIMFICTGNICRSAMAEWLLKKKLKDNNKNDVNVCSAGLHANTGAVSTDEAIEVMKKYDVDLTKHRATNIGESNVREMDLILCATNRHKIMILNAYPELNSIIFTLKEYVVYKKMFHDKITYKITLKELIPPFFIGMATAIPSCISCKQIAKAILNPNCSDTSKPAPITNPSGRL